MVLLMYCGIQFGNILLGIFASVLIRGIGLMTFLGGMLRFCSHYLLCMYCRFLPSDYFEAYM